MRQQGNRHYQGRTGNYIDGNTVKRIHAQPKKHSEEVHEELVHRREVERKHRERKKNARTAARKNMERAMQMSPGYVLFLATAVVVMVSVIACYLLLHSDLSARMKHVNTLESDVMNLKNENDAVQKKINTSVDLETIRKKAMEELGMVYPSEGQIKYFDVDTEDYMNQYEDIPER